MTTERLLNMYPEVSPGRLPVTLRSAPGLSNQVQLGDGRVRALQSVGDTLYACVAGTLVSWNGSTVTTLGGIPDGPTTMASNGTQVCLSVAGGYYVLDGTTLSPVSQGAFTSVGSVAYIDGYGVRSELNGSRFDVTGINNFSTIDATDFASAEHKPDNVVRALVNNGILWILGEDTVEAWQNVGSADFPFARLSSTVIEKGVQNAQAAAEMDNSFIWVSSEPRAYRQEGFAPVKVSTPAVDAAIGTDTTCFTYQHEGHDFFVVRRDGATAWVFDAATQSWHERGTLDGAWNATATVQHQKTWYAGTLDGYLCTFDGFQDQGQTLLREAVSRNATNAGNRFRVSKVNARLEVGNGGNYLYSYTNDGGRTFSPERRRVLSTSGQYKKNIQISCLGQHREFALRLRCTDNIDFAIYNAGVELG